MELLEKKPALVLIDVQKGFEDEAYWGGNRNNKDAESKMARLLHRWRALGWPIFHVQHSSQNPASRLHRSHPGFELKEEVKPVGMEPVIVKEVNSAFIGTDLQERLDKADIKSLVIAGMTTNHCISTSVRMAANLGYEVLLLSDATATFDRVGIDGEHYEADLIHRTALASLQEEFAEIKTTNEVLGSF